MISSYSLSQNFDRHVLLFWTVAVPIYRSAVAIESAWRFIRAALPALLLWLGILAKALGLVAIVAGAVALGAIFWWPICQLVGGLLIVGAFGWATYPRAVRK